MLTLPVTDLSNLDASALAAIEAVVSGQRDLKAVLDWCLGQNPPMLDAAVVEQDEFSHDLIVPWSDGRYLVYDVT